MRKKCHNCKGVGKVMSRNIGGNCYYCLGKGWRINNYGQDWR